MKNHTKYFLVLLVAVVFLTGCNTKGNVRQGVADNDVLTLTEIPEDKIMLTMRTGDGMDVNQITSAIEKKFPKVELIVKHNTFDVNDLSNGNVEDIVLSGGQTGFRGAPEGTLIDLSSYDFVSNYYLTALNDCQIDGRLYYLPGPSTVTGIVYDKELFDQNGWKPATSLDEFIELCKTIEATGIHAIQPTIKFHSAARLLFTGFTYADTFAGVEGYQWLNDYKTGKSNMVGHMEKGFETMQRLLEAGIWSASDFNMEPKKRSDMLYKDHSTAMIIETQMAPNYAKQIGQGDEHEIAMMPFYSGNDKGDDYLIADPTFFIGLNAHLKDEGNEDRLKAAIDIIEYISSVEGQQAIISEQTPLISNVIGVETSQGEFLSGVEKTIAEGRVVNTPYYWGSQNSQIDVAFGKKLREYAEGKATVNDVLAASDEARNNILKNQGSKGTLIGKASKDFTVMESALYFADAFKKKADAQIGLCLANSRKLGINSKIYKGDIYTDTEESLGGFLQKYFFTNENKKTLTLVSMTGENIKTVLSEIVGNFEDYNNCYFVASGLKIEFAPWAKKGKNIVKVCLENGDELKDDGLYNVAVWNGIIDERLISKTEHEYTDTIVDIFVEAIKRDGGTIEPFEDDRFVLNWKEN